MIVSWSWLKDYVDVTWPIDEVTRRLAMTGLNHEGTLPVGKDWAIDLEVTSNRADCLGHIGVAREIAVLVERPLKIPQPSPKVSNQSVADLVKVRIDCPHLCPCYTARLLRGVKVGPSPGWLRDRLQVLGLQSVNNVVDVTNYVMLECGQPLHAFDFAAIADGTIVVREGKADEPFTAIDHRTYKLNPSMCVIADTKKGVAIGGVMGGAESEVSNSTTDVLIEAAQFDPISIRNTARLLSLHSPSSFRFERGIDPDTIDWASQRCCALIQEIAGGELLSGVVIARNTTTSETRPLITLRLSEIPRVLGIEIPTERVQAILAALEMEPAPSKGSDKITVTAPSWRRDVTREIDLIEEVARIYGYEFIPEDISVPMVPSQPRASDAVMAKIRRVLTADGFHEAMTASVIPQQWSETISPWSDRPPLRTALPLLRGADCLRRSLIPSLLAARRENERLSNDPIELFETARVYLPNPSGLPVEPVLVGMTSGRSFLEVKGILELLLAELAPGVELEVTPRSIPLLDPRRTVELSVHGKQLGFLGELDQRGRAQFELQRPTTVAEVKFEQLQAVATAVVTYVPPPSQPSIDRDVNLILDDEVLWSNLVGTIRQIPNDILEEITYQEIYRDESKDGPGKKRLLFSLRFRAGDRTLTGEEVDSLCRKIISACEQKHDAKLVA